MFSTEENKNLLKPKDDFQFVLCTLESLLFALFHVHVNHHFGCEALCFALSLITSFFTFEAVKFNEVVGKRI